MESNKVTVKIIIDTKSTLRQNTFYFRIIKQTQLNESCFYCLKIFYTKNYDLNSVFQKI